MLSIEKRMTMLAIAAIGGSSFAAPAAMAGDVPGDGGNGGRTKCNASRGNGSEGCDPAGPPSRPTEPRVKPRRRRGRSDSGGTGTP